jgi:hypothetical protein
MNYFKCLEIEQQAEPVQAEHLVVLCIFCAGTGENQQEGCLCNVCEGTGAKFGGEMMKIERAARLARDAMSAVLTQRDWHLDTDLLFGDLETALEALNEAIPKQAEPVQAEDDLPDRLMRIHRAAAAEAVAKFAKWQREQAEPVVWDPQCPLCGGSRQAALAQQAEPPAIFKHPTEKKP